MIRINLVGEARKQVVTKAAGPRGSFLEEFLEGENAALIWLVTPVVIVLLAGGVYWWRLSQTIQANASVIVEKERRVEELREIIERVERYEREAAELERKIEVITQLKDSQSGPVDMMDVVSRSLPELLWVDRLDQNGERIQIDGRAFNFNAVSAFIRALDDSPYFQEPVLDDTNRRGDVLTYRLTLQKEIPLDPADTTTDDPADTATETGL